MARIFNLADRRDRKDDNQSDRPRNMKDALEMIAFVEGEDDPALLWPWAQEIARQGLQKGK